MERKREWEREMKVRSARNEHDKKWRFIQKAIGFRFFVRLWFHHYTRIYVLGQFFMCVWRAITYHIFTESR